MSRLIDISGKKIGKLTVVRISSRDRNNHIRWECICDCGNIHTALGTHLRREKITHCGCMKKRGRDSPSWTGCGELSGNYWDSVKRGANGSKGKRKPVELSITKRFAWLVFLKQKRKCALSGVQLRFAEVVDNMYTQTASLDRIDSSKGYIEGNIQWVHKDVNKMKNTFDQKYFIEMCKKIDRHNI